MLKQTSSIKGHTVNILGFSGHNISAPTTQLCHYGLEAAIHRTCKRMGMAVFQINFIYGNLNFI